MLKADTASEDKHIIVSAGNSLSAKADGAVSLTGEDTSIKLSDISAGTDLNITTTGKGDITFVQTFLIFKAIFVLKQNET